MSYFDRQRNCLEPQVLLDCILEKALIILSIGDETSIEEIPPLRKGVEIVAREYGLSLGDRELFHRLEKFEQELKRACSTGDPLPELQEGERIQASILEILWSLFDLATALEDAGERRAILDLASYLMDFLDLEGNLKAHIRQSA